MKVHQEVFIMVESVKMIKCSEVDLDSPESSDINYLITGACVCVADDVYYVSEEILKDLGAI